MSHRKTKKPTTKKRTEGRAEVNASVPQVRTADLPALPDLTAPGADETAAATSMPEPVPATGGAPGGSEAQGPTPTTSTPELASNAEGTPAPTEAQDQAPENDKAALSEDDLLESEFAVENEDTGSPDPVFTPLDQADFRRLDAEVDKGTRRAFAALREIRQRKLYRLPKDEQGNKLYPTFDAHVQQRHGHTRVRVTQGTNWLRIVESLEQVGLPVPLPVDAAQGLRCHLIKDAGGLVAIFKEAQEDGVPLTKDNLRAIVERRASYFREGAKVAATSYAEYKRDTLVAKALGAGTWGSVTDARKLPGDFADNLIPLCTERTQTPRAEQVLEVVTGKALEEIVTSLGTLAQRQEDIEAKKSRLKMLKKEFAGSELGLAKAAPHQPEVGYLTFPALGPM